MSMKRELNPIANHSLFFSAEDGGRAFGAVLSDVQEYISQGYSALIATGSEESKEQIKRFISKYLLDNRITAAGYSTPQLVDALYTEMAEFSFLTKYIFGNGDRLRSNGGSSGASEDTDGRFSDGGERRQVVEEINVNAWNDIEVQYSNGECVKLDETFESPDHAINVVRRMLHVSGMVLDNASPAVLGHLSKNIRIAVMKAPLVDEDVGVACSIRIVNPQSLGKEDFVNGGAATEPMLDFLSTCLSAVPTVVGTWHIPSAWRVRPQAAKPPWQGGS